jgi:serine/threonine protein phosphatase 1
MISEHLHFNFELPKLPEGLRIYAIGDVHGRADLLNQLFARIDAHLAADPVLRPVEVYLGDYIDRGPASREVLDRLIRRQQWREMVCLKGNHETLFAEFLEDPVVLSDWRHLGGFETLLSYGIVPSMSRELADQQKLAAAFAQAVPESHRRFLSSLKSSFSCGDFFFVHAGVRPGIPLAKQSDYDLLWIRDEFLLSEEDFGKIVVHGHTPVREPEVLSNRINIDTGAYATGRLTCLVLEDYAMYFV